MISAHHHMNENWGPGKPCLGSIIKSRETTESNYFISQLEVSVIRDFSSLDIS